jgi:eukaryotic-like serine/threonine-protein kinase
MKPLVALAILFASAIALGADDKDNWPQLGGGPDHNNFRPRTNAVLYPTILWKFEKAFGQPTIWNGLLYCGGESLFCLDAEKGTLVASYPPDGSVKFSPAPALDKDMVIARHGQGDVTAFSHKLAQQLWTYAPEGQGSDYGHPGSLAEGLYIFGHGSKVIALQAKDGKPAWTFETPDKSPVEMTPAIANKLVFFGTSSGSLFALKLETGQIAWTQKSEAEFGWTYPIATFGAVFLGDRGIRGGRKGALNAFDLMTGKPKWTQEFGATGMSTPGFMPGYVFAGFGKFVALFDVKDGKVKDAPVFKTDFNPFGSPTVIGDAMMFGNLDGNLYCFDAKSARLLWAVNVGKDVQALDFTYWKGRIFLSTSKQLLAIGQAPGKGKAPGGFILKVE